MRYSKEETVSLHQKMKSGNCLSNFNVLLKKEGCSEKKMFDEYVEVIDMDCIEINDKKKKSSQRNQSMDVALMIKEEKPNRKEVLLVELKFNSQNPRNLRDKDIIGKINFSKQYFSGIQVHNNFVFVFQNNLLAQARQHIARLYSSNTKVIESILLMDVRTLKNNYFSDLIS